jgi:hypothetical protein
MKLMRNNRRPSLRRDVAILFVGLIVSIVGVVLLIGFTFEPLGDLGPNW